MEPGDWRKTGGTRGLMERLYHEAGEERMDYRLSKNVMADDAMRSTFNDLVVKTFHLSFENWYQEGYCSDSYLPYTLFHGDRAVANVSVNRMEMLWKGQVRRYIQLGTVMTDTEYRNQGLSRYLLEEVLKDCVFYSRQHDAVVIAEQDGEHLVCYDVYCDGGRKLQDVLSSIAAAGTRTVSLGLAPKDWEGFEPEPVVDEEDTLFVLRGGENIFRNDKMLFPLISHI